jgi:hypothetical protein
LLLLHICSGSSPSRLNDNSQSQDQTRTSQTPPRLSLLQRRPRLGRAIGVRHVPNCVDDHLDPPLVVVAAAAAEMWPLRHMPPLASQLDAALFIDLPGDRRRVQPVRDKCLVVIVIYRTTAEGSTTLCGIQVITPHTHNDDDRVHAPSKDGIHRRRLAPIAKGLAVGSVLDQHRPVPPPLERHEQGDGQRLEGVGEEAGLGVGGYGGLGRENGPAAFRLLLCVNGVLFVGCRDRREEFANRMQTLGTEMLTSSSSRFMFSHPPTHQTLQPRNQSQHTSPRRSVLPPPTNPPPRDARRPQG